MTATCETVRIKLGNVLYLTDFSPISDCALRYVRAITDQFEAKVLVTHVIESPEYRFVPPEGWAVVESATEDAARRQLEALDARMAGIPHETMLRRGEVWQEAARLVEDQDVQLIVVGSHGRTGLRRFLMGSVAEEIIRRAHRPVLTVGPGVLKDGPVPRIARIVLATDFGSASIEAIPCTLMLAELHDARVSLLHVMKSLPAPEERPEQLRSEAENRLRASITRQDKSRIAEAIVRFGDPAEEICKYALQKRADLVVLGLKRTDQHIALATHVSRATAHSVVCSAPCPVLAVMR